MADKIILTTICVVWDKPKQRIVLINRQKGDWRGYAPPGGHVDFPESFVDCAIREVNEETGLTVWGLSFKGLTHFVNADTQDRYLVFNYITDQFSGELNPGTSEGVPEWIPLAELDQIHFAAGMRERLDLFFRAEPSEQHVIWDQQGRREEKIAYL